MQPTCLETMRTARTLLDYGVFDEGTEALSKLHGCGRSAGCGHWNRCVHLVEGQWQSSKPENTERRAATR